MEQLYTPPYISPPLRRASLSVSGSRVWLDNVTERLLSNSRDGDKNVFWTLLWFLHEDETSPRSWIEDKNYEQRRTLGSKLERSEDLSGFCLTLSLSANILHIILMLWPRHCHNSKLVLQNMEIYMSSLVMYARSKVQTEVERPFISWKCALFVNSRNCLNLYNWKRPSQDIVRHC